MEVISRNFKGEPVASTRVSLTTHKPSSGKSEKIPTDVYFSVDRSGSMSYDMEAVRDNLVRVLTTAEYADLPVRVTLISTSSKGDMTIHFRHSDLSRVTDPRSNERREIASLRGTCLTNLSQPLHAIASMLDPTRPSVVVYHTDGYANDPSPSSEVHEIKAAMNAIKSRNPNVTINTVGHRDWCDHTLLASIAEGSGGRYFRCPSGLDLQRAFIGVLQEISQSSVPVFEVPKGPDGTMIVTSGGKVTMGNVIRGISGDEELSVFSFENLGSVGGSQTSAPGSDAVYCLALARYLLAKGDVARSKFALVASRDTELVSRHYRALTPAQIADYSAALEARIVSLLYGGGSSVTYHSEYGIPGLRGLPATDFFAVLSKHAGHVRVDYRELMSRYVRRGVKSILGRRDPETGVVTPPRVASRSKVGSSGLRPIVGVTTNRTSANISILVSDDIELVDFETGKVYENVHGVDLGHLKSFNNLTLVGDGEFCVSHLRILPTTDEARSDLLPFAESVSLDGVMVISFVDRPMVDFSNPFDLLSGDSFRRMARLTALRKILSEYRKTSGQGTLTAEQVEALREIHVTESLNFSPPSVTPYTSLDEAIRSGQIDSRVCRTVKLGTTDLLSLSDLPSANEYLKRRFELTLNGEKVEPKFSMVLAGAKAQVKKLTKATKLNAIDDLLYPIYESLLVGDSSIFRDLLKDAGCPEDSTELFHRMMMGAEPISAEWFDQAIREIDRVVDLSVAKITPTVFFVGSSGLVPFPDAEEISAETLTARYPSLKVSKNDADNAVFYLLSEGRVLTVGMTSEYFSTGLGNPNPSA